jgi:hypothetical protein
MKNTFLIIVLKYEKEKKKKKNELFFLSLHYNSGILHDLKILNRIISKYILQKMKISHIRQNYFLLNCVLLKKVTQ